MLPAQSPQRSACFAPRRASEYVIRITAPCCSSTSLPQLSQTRMVLRAMAQWQREFGPKSRGHPRLPNWPRTEQAEERLFFRVETDIPGADDAQLPGAEILGRT